MVKGNELKIFFLFSKRPTPNHSPTARELCSFHLTFIHSFSNYKNKNKSSQTHYLKSSHSLF